MGIVLVVTALVHAPVLTARALCFDDDIYINHNALVRNPSWRSVQRFFTEWTHPSSIPGYPHPLAMTSLMMDVAMGGGPESLTPFHVTNLLLHLGCTVVLMLLVYRLIGHPWITGVVGLVFAVHPLAVEPLAWIAQRKTLLAALFGWLALLLYPYPPRRRCVPGYIGSLLCYILALLSKPTALPIPVVIALLHLMPRTDPSPERKRRVLSHGRRDLARAWGSVLVDLLPFFAIAAAAAVLVIVTNITPPMSATPVLPISARLLAAADQIGRHIQHMCVPIKLSPCYPRPEPLTLANPSVLLGVVVTAALFVVMVAGWRSFRRISIGIAAWLVLVLPTAGIVPFGAFYTFDNYAYLPAICWAWMLAAVIVAAMRRGAVVRYASICALVILVSTEILLTRRYLAHWRDTESLYRMMIARYPTAATPYSDLGARLADEGRTAEAITLYTKGLAIDDSSAALWNNYANALAAMKRYTAAADAYTQALHRREDFPGAHQGLAFVLIQLHDLDAARRHLERAIELQPHYVAARDNLAYVLMQLGETDEAIATWKRILEFAPDETRVHANLAAAYVSLGQGAAAIPHLEAVLRKDPKDIAALNTLAWILTTATDPTQRDPSRAVALAERACKLAPQPGPAPLRTLARAYAAGGRFERAIATVEQALAAATQQADPALVGALQSDRTAYRARQIPPASQPTTTQPRPVEQRNPRPR